MRSVAVILSAITLAVVASPVELAGRVAPCSDGVATAANGRKFEVQCGVEAVARDIGTAAYFDTAQACYDQCSTTSGCVGVSWTSGSGTSNTGTTQGGPCYLKSKVINIRTKANARVAKAFTTYDSCQDYIQDATDICYRRTAYLGECQNFPGEFNDQLSSVKIPAGYTCAFYV
jgi:hypothetical protein